MTTSAISDQSRPRLSDWRRWAGGIRRAQARPCRRCDPYHPCDRCGTPWFHRQIRLAPDPASVRKARDFVQTNLCDLGFAESAGDGMLIVSELATNAIHAAPENPYVVKVRIGSGHPVIEVHDHSPEPPEKCEPDFV